MSLLAVLASLALCLLLSKGKAQMSQSTASCNDFSYIYPWVNNSKGQEPCLVVSYLQIPCIGQVNTALQELQFAGDRYHGPSEQNDCLCNTVTYSLIEACQLCQFYNPAYMLPWTGFSSNCTNRINGSYPHDVPTGTAIPAWAYLDVSVTDKFDATKASQVAAQHLPDITTASPTSSGASTTATSSAISTTAASKNVAAIVGGVVGGVLGIIFLVGTTFAIYVALRKRKLRSQAQAEPLESSETPISTATAVDDGRPNVKPMAMISTPIMLYNPDDPRTFPSSQTPPNSSTATTVSPAPDGPPAFVGGYVPHSFGAMQSYSASSFGGDHGRGYADAAYKSAL